jgi:hypothetical protein
VFKTKRASTLLERIHIQQISAPVCEWQLAASAIVVGMGREQAESSTFLFLQIRLAQRYRFYCAEVMVLCWRKEMALAKLTTRIMTNAPSDAE